MKLLIFWAALRVVALLAFTGFTFSALLDTTYLGG